MITSKQQLESKLFDDLSNMNRALPSLPMEDSYYQELGEVTNLIAGDYADKFTSLNGGRILTARQYLLFLYLFDADVDSTIITAMVHEMEGV